MPRVTLSVTVMTPPAASTSAIEMPVIARSVSRSTYCASGSVTIGASFTAATVMATVFVSVSTPPEPVLPPSFAVTVSVSEPLKSRPPR